MPAELQSIAALKSTAGETPVEARVHAQVTACTRKETRDGKPFFELTLADAQSKFTLRAWSDSPAYPLCEQLAENTFVEVTGEFALNGPYGLDARRWTLRPLTTTERDELLGGPPELRVRQAADFEYITGAINEIADPRLRVLGQIFLSEYADRYRRAAAARGNHHARRGGLVEHVAQMMRSATAICSVYAQLNRDLIIAAVLFHDCGKMWENQLPADGFVMPYDELGEMLGHITIGIELVNSLWRKLREHPEWDSWKNLTPSSEDVRIHLLHLLASHHGELQFGSPVVPKTPEAMALHYIDNLDARLEMFAQGYITSKQIAPRIQERVWPLVGHLVRPLPKLTPPDSD